MGAIITIPSLEVRKRGTERLHKQPGITEGVRGRFRSCSRCSKSHQCSVGRKEVSRQVGLATCLEPWVQPKKVLRQQDLRTLAGIWVCPVLARGLGKEAAEERDPVTQGLVSLQVRGDPVSSWAR